MVQKETKQTAMGAGKITKHALNLWNLSRNEDWTEGSRPLSLSANASILSKSAHVSRQRHATGRNRPISH